MKKFSLVHSEFHFLRTLQRLSKSFSNDYFVYMRTFTTRTSNTLCYSQQKHISTHASSTLFTSSTSSSLLSPRSSNHYTSSSNSSRNENKNQPVLLEVHHLVLCQFQDLAQLEVRPQRLVDTPLKVTIIDNWSEIEKSLLQLCTNQIFAQATY